MSVELGLYFTGVFTGGIVVYLWKSLQHENELRAIKNKLLSKKRTLEEDVKKQGVIAKDNDSSEYDEMPKPTLHDSGVQPYSFLLCRERSLTDFEDKYNIKAYAYDIHDGQILAKFSLTNEKAEVMAVDDAVSAWTLDGLYYVSDK